MCYKRHSIVKGYERQEIKMTIGDRIFERLKEIKMTQKEFSNETGISQSTISEWKSKKNNPTSEKIMIICKVLDVTPEWLLSGADNRGERSNDIPWYVVERETELGEIITEYHKMDEKQRSRLLGYISAISQLMSEGK